MLSLEISCKVPRRPVFVAENNKTCGIYGNFHVLRNIEIFFVKMFSILDAPNNNDISLEQSLDTTNILALTYKPEESVEGPELISDNLTDVPEIARGDSQVQTLAIEDKPHSPMSNDNTGNALVVYKENNIRALRRKAKDEMYQLEQRQQKAAERSKQVCVHKYRASTNKFCYNHLFM